MASRPGLRLKLTVATTLIALSLVPESMAFYHLIHNGGMQWPMIWGNETRAWSAIFSLLALNGSALAIVIRKQTPYRSTLLMLFASTIVALSMYALVWQGLGPSSKGDDDELHLKDFWSSGWSE